MLAQDQVDENEVGVGPWTSTQTWAVIWFFGALTIGITFSYFIEKLDHFMYKTNAETLDYEAYSDNRSAFSSITSDSLDPRSNALFSNAK